MRVRWDLHTHTQYSDGWDWEEMADAAETVGLEAIGFTDHCPLGSDSFGRREAYDFAETYPDRRRAFAADLTDRKLRILDGVEVNYEPDKEATIATFLETAGFEYTIGSVHFTEAYNVANPSLSAAAPSTKREAIDRYVTWQVALIESELFDIVSHLDVVQRSPALRGLMTHEDYVKVADALVESRTIPEINAGRLDREYGTIHPHPDVLDLFADRDISFVVGTDSHAPDQLHARVELLNELLPELPVKILDQPPVLDTAESISRRRSR